MTAALIVFAIVISASFGYLIGGWHERTWQRERRGGYITPLPGTWDDWDWPQSTTTSTPLNDKLAATDRRP